MGRLTAIVFVLLALVGCAAPPPQAGQPDEYTQQYTQQVQERQNRTPGTEEVEAARSLALESCAALDNGVSPDSLVTELLRETTSEYNRQTMYIAVGVGLAVYCPEHIDSF